MRILRQWLPILMLLLAIGTRLHMIDNQSLWHDEGNSLRLAERNLADLIDATSHDIHPPGYYVALKYWIQGVGTTEFSLRSLSALWGLLAVAGTYTLGKRLFGKDVGLLAGLLIATNPFAVYYGQEARMYTQLGALSVLSLWCFAVIITKTNRRAIRQVPNENTFYIGSWALSLVAINTLGLYTQYTFPATIAVELVLFGWWYIQHQDKRALTTFVALNLLTLMLFTPWIDMAYEQVTTWPSTGNTVPFIERLDRIITILIYGQPVSQLTLGYALIPLCLVLLVVFSLRNSIKTLVLPTYFWRLALPSLLVILSVASLLVSGAYREANLKFLLPAQSALAILLAVGGLALRNAPTKIGKIQNLGWLGIILVLMIMAINSRNLDHIYNDENFARSDYRGIARTIDQLARDGDAVILNAPNQEEVFSYYFDGNIPIYPLPRGLGGDDIATRTEMETILANHRRIFLVLWGADERDPNHIVETTLHENAYFISHRWMNDVQLVQYAVLGNVPEEPQEDESTRFGDRLDLIGYTLSDQEFEAHSGDVLGVTLYWELIESLDKQYKVSIQLLYPDGRLAAQGQDSALLLDAQFQRNSQAILIDSSLTMGTYTLIIGVYDAMSPMDRLAPNGSLSQDNAYVLAEIRLK